MEIPEGFKAIHCLYCDSVIITKKNFGNTQACKNCIENGKPDPDPRKSKEAKEKRKRTLIEKYGVDNVQKIKEISLKTTETFRKKYGGRGLGSKELAEITKNKLKEKYGSENIMKTEYGKEMFRGEKNPVKKGNEAAIKISKSLKGRPSKLKGKTYEDIFGIEKAELIKNKKADLILEDFTKKLDIYVEHMNLELLDDKYKGAHYNHLWKCKKCGGEFEQIWNKIQQGFICPVCFPRHQGYSIVEKELAEFIKSLGFEIIENDRSLIPPREVDIVIPSLKVAFEFNGLYFHTEDFKTSPSYHLDKTVDLKKLGIRLYQIFEDEWVYKNTITKKRIENILGLNKGEKINARECEIGLIDSKTKNHFLETYHIQGKDNSLVKLGLIYKGILVSVMTFSLGNIAKGFKRKDGVWELSRFCSDYNYSVRGAAGKLLSHFINNYEWKQIFSYSDLRWSSGDIYRKLGFKTDEKIILNYWYTTGHCDRIHRFKLRKKKTEPKEIPEKILRIQEGYKIIWDCGNLKFTINKE